MSDPTNINFWSGKNYMKRDSSTGVSNLAAPVTANFGIFTTQSIITHNLGIVPFFELYYEGFKDNVVWTTLGSRTSGNAINPANTAQAGPYCLGFADTTTLTLEIGYSNNTLTGTYPVYYIIYKDFGIA